MKHSKSLIVTAAVIVCAMAMATDASAQRRSGGGRAPSGGGRSSGGSTAPRGGGSRGTVVAPRGGAPRGGAPRGIVTAPYRSYYRPYRPGFSLGFYAGYPFYPYGYYPYASYGYSGYYGDPGYYGPGYYGPGYYGPGYYGPGYYGSGYNGYAVAPGYGYARPGGTYSGVRIQDAPEDAQVFVDGYYAGNVDDFDGPFQRLDLAPGPHEIEIRIPGQQPRAYDVNVTPGQTTNLHVR